MRGKARGKAARQWQRSADGEGDWQDVASNPKKPARYHLSESDAGQYLRAYREFTMGGDRYRAETTVIGPVEVDG